MEGLLDDWLWIGYQWGQWIKWYNDGMLFMDMNDEIEYRFAIRVFFLNAYSKGSRFTLGVWGWSCVRRTLRLCSQPSATVRNRPQPFVWGPYGRAYGKFCKRGHLWSFPVSRSFISRGRRGTSWHSNMFHDVSKVVFVAGTIFLPHFQKMHCTFRGKRSTLDTSDVILRGRRSTLECCVFFAKRIVSAARRW